MSDPILGVDGTSGRQTQAVEVERGWRIVLYTDGVTERRGVSLDAGFAWSLGVVTGHDGETASAIADRVITALGESPEDDVALLVIAP